MAGTDIHKYIADRAGMERDFEGHLLELEPWSEAQARTQAEAEGITLGDEHWAVLHFLRERFIHDGQAKSGRHVLKALEQEFAEKGGKRHLYMLFPDGPVAQGCRLAGLPLPPYTTDPSFGSRG